MVRARQPLYRSGKHDRAGDGGGCKEQRATKDEVDGQHQGMDGLVGGGGPQSLEDPHGLASDHICSLSGDAPTFAMDKGSVSSKLDYYVAHTSAYKF